MFYEAAGALRLCHSGKVWEAFSLKFTSLCGVRSLMGLKLSELEERESLVHLSCCSLG